MWCRRPSVQAAPCTEGRLVQLPSAARGVLVGQPMRHPALLWPTLALIGACSAETSSPTPAPDASPDPVPLDAPVVTDAELPTDAGTPDPRDAGEIVDTGAPVEPSDAGGPAPDGGPISHECAPSEGVCTAWNEAIACVETPAGRRWQPTTCSSGGGYQGACRSDQCSDECTLGARNGNRRCDLWDVDTDAWVGLDDDRLHDRARRFEKWLRRDTESLFHDGIVSVKYTSEDRRTRRQHLHRRHRPAHRRLPRGRSLSARADRRAPSPGQHRGPDGGLACLVQRQRRSREPRDDRGAGRRP